MAPAEPVPVPETIETVSKHTARCVVLTPEGKVLFSDVVTWQNHTFILTREIENGKKVR